MKQKIFRELSILSALTIFIFSHSSFALPNENTCLKKIDLISSRPNEIPPKEQERLSKLFSEEVTKKFGASGVAFLKASKEFDESYARFLKLYQDARIERVQALKTQSELWIKQSLAYKKRYGIKMRGHLCNELQSFNIARKNPFNFVEFKLYGDLDERDNFKLTFSQFSDAKSMIRDGSIPEVSARDQQWMLTCFLKPPVDYDFKNAANYTSSEVICILPNFQSTSRVTYRTDSRWKWLPKIFRGYKSQVDGVGYGNTFDGSCPTGSNPITRLKFRGSAVCKTNTQGASVLAPTVSLKDVVLFGGISGNIKDRFTNFPLNQAHADLNTTTRLSTVPNTSTNSAGDYSMKLLPLSARDHSTVHASKDGYYPSELPLDRLEPGKTMTNYDFALDPIPVDLWGIAYNDATKTPITNEKISIRAKFKMPNGKIFETIFSTTTDGNGRYEIHALPWIYNVFESTTETRIFNDLPADVLVLVPGPADRNAPLNRIQKDLHYSPNPTTISGRILDERSGQPLAKMHVKITHQGTGEVLANTVTDQNGLYSWTDASFPSKISQSSVVISAYDTLEVNPPSATSSNYFPAEHKYAILDQTPAGRNIKDQSPYRDADQVLTYVSNPDRNLSLKRRYVSLTVNVMNGRTGNPLNAKVKITYRGSEHAQSTGSGGTTVFDNIPAGNYPISINANGFTPYDTHVVIANEDVEKTYALLPIEFAAHKIVTVLTWSHNPADLDSHLYGSKSKRILNYKTLGDGGITEEMKATLDRDDTTSYGPETTVIDLDANGCPVMDYKFLVYDYSQEASMTDGGNWARVEVFMDAKFVASYESVKAAGNVPGSGYLWHAFNIKNCKIEGVNEFQLSNLYLKIKRQVELIKKLDDQQRDLENKLGQIDPLEGRYAKAKNDLIKNKSNLYLWTMEDQNFTEEEKAYLGWAKLPPSRVQDLTNEINTFKHMADTYAPAMVETMKGQLDQAKTVLDSLKSQTVADPNDVLAKLELEQKVKGQEKAVDMLEEALKLAKKENPKKVYGQKVKDTQKIMDDGLAQVPLYRQKMAQFQNEKDQLEALVQQKQADPTVEHDPLVIAIQNRIKALLDQKKQANDIIIEQEAKIADAYSHYR